jgi:hypothetical protein
MRDRPTRVFLKGRLRVEARVRFAHRLLRAVPHSKKLGDVPHEEAALAGRPSTSRRERDRPRRAFPGGGGFEQQPGARFAVTGFFYSSTRSNFVRLADEQKSRRAFGTDGFWSAEREGLPEAGFPGRGRLRTTAWRPLRGHRLFYSSTRSNFVRLADEQKSRRAFGTDGF